MSTHGSEGASAADVVVELVLQIDERVVALDVELNVAQNACDNVRSDSEGLRLDDDFLHGCRLA